MGALEGSRVESQCCRAPWTLEAIVELSNLVFVVLSSLFSFLSSLFSLLFSLFSFLSSLLSLLFSLFSFLSFLLCICPSVMVLVRGKRA